MAMYLKTNIKHLLRAKGMTQEELGNQVGKTRTTVNNWISGVSSPNLDEVTKMSIIFNISGQELLFKDLTVQVSDDGEASIIQQNVQGNVQASVQVKGKNQEFNNNSAVSEDNGISYSELKKQNDTLTMAVAALSASNQRLLLDVEELREENQRLKKGPPTIGGGMESTAQRATG